ncbi:MAG: hypothetical protein ACLU30_08935 [Odoribacter splanchnicus]
MNLVSIRNTVVNMLWEDRLRVNYRLDSILEDTGMKERGKGLGISYRK